MDDLQKYRSEIIITKFGKPIAKLIPMVDDQAEKSLFGYMKDSVLIHEDILEKNIIQSHLAKCLTTLKSEEPPNLNNCVSKSLLMLD